MKKFIYLLVFVITFLSCKKDHDGNSAKCDWFPIQGNIKYKRETIANNQPPYLATEVGTTILSDTVIVIGPARFVLTDCSGGKVLLSYNSAERAPLFDKNKTDVANLITTSSYRITQVNSIHSISSELQFAGNRAVSLRVLFVPKTGILQMEEINAITGEVNIRYTKLL